MKKTSIIVLISAVGIAIANDWMRAQGTAVTRYAQVTAFVNVNAVPMDTERVLEDWTVVVGDGKIIATGPAAATPVPEGATTIDGSGRYLLPGLTEMHGHIPPPASSDPAYVESVLYLYVANGVTTVRGMQGAPGQLELRERSARNEIVAPTLILAGPAFTGGNVKSPEDAVARVKAQKQEGWDLLKVQGGLSVATYDAMADAAQELAMPFAGHVPQAVGVEHAISKRQATIDHLDRYIEDLGGTETALTEAQIRPLVARTVESGTAVVPTMYVWETLRGPVSFEERTALAELQYLPDDVVAQWTKSLGSRLNNPNFDAEAAGHYIANRMTLLRMLSEAGARILLGSDAPQQFNVPGFSIHHEMQRMIDAGMTPYQVIESGTAAVGRHFRQRGSFGQIAIGHRADLILLSANPLEDVGNVRAPEGVMLRGRWLPGTEIDERLTEIANLY